MRSLFSISRTGSFRRPVIVIGRWAMKFARNARGRRCNEYEADLYRSVSDERRRMLCPAIWVSSGGVPLIMAAATPLAEPLSLDEYMGLFEERDYFPGADARPFEPKLADWGWYGGRRVALDYSTPARRWGCRLAFACASMILSFVKRGKLKGVSADAKKNACYDL